MGNDGGSIPKRRELVKEAARDPSTTEYKEALNESQNYLWTTDPISNSPLQPPIVSDCTGTLYNKDSVLEFLLPSEDNLARKAEIDKNLNGNVKSLKDVVEVKFENDPEHKNKWICPITNKTLGPKLKSIYLVPCGHAFAAIVAKELKEDKCLQCGESFEVSNIIPILPTAESDVKILETRIVELRERGLTHSLKKAQGSKKRKNNTATDNNNEATSKAKDNMKPTATINNSSTASLTAKVLQEQEERNKKRRLAGNEHIDSLYSKDQGIAAKKNDFFTRGFTLPGQQKP